MKDLQSIQQEISAMSQVALKMLETTHAAFMEHDRDLITTALEEETKLNDMEKSITSSLVEFGHGCAKKEERNKVAILTDVVGDLEMIGDYCKDILERVEIKIEEKLLFSEDGVKEYNNLYALAEKSMKEVASALEKNLPSSVKAVLKHEEHIDSLVDEYRRRHTQRMIDKVCTPMGCNMFLNMLDFTAAIYYHIKKIAKGLLKIKNV
ncbi:MAG: PhoU domain-containing protein [Candidatus Omnitrophica bacterium]|nr:PhoU domain-containing protein [Candidatus Omnitrophota bacterium]MDD5653145.1 PhoU domain-containing protein [Candidatus Omnitrophota bacterium]